MSAVVSAPARLQAFLAALTELQESERAPLLRAYLEYTLELAQASEQRYYDFLGECAALAADNMQDIRIEHLAQRLDAAESPPARPWGEVVTDVALGFALQLGVLLGWEMVAGGVIALAGGRALLRATRSAQIEVGAARSKSFELASKHWSMWHTRSNLLQLEYGGFRAKSTRGGWLVSPASGTWRYGGSESFEVPSGLIYSRDGKISLDYIRKEIDDISLEIKLAEAATDSNNKRMQDALKTYEAALADGTKASDKIKSEWGDTWRNNVGNEKGGLLLSTTEEIVKAIDEIGKNAHAAPQSSTAVVEPFLSSEVTGRYLDWIGEAWLDTTESYANMRLMLHAASDDDLVEGDDFLKMIALLGTEVLPRWQELIARSFAARPAIVKGMEAAFWREYLSANGILAEAQPVNKVASSPHSPGAIVGGYLIKSAGKEHVYSEPQLAAMRKILEESSVPEPFEPPPASYDHDALLYPGASRIPQPLASSLFRRFAQPYYENANHAKTLSPFAYTSSRYAGAKVPPEDDVWGYPNPESLRKIDEMRFMVVRFFGSLSGDTVDPALTSAFETLSFMGSVSGEEAARSRDDWLSAQMQCDSADGAALVEAEIVDTFSSEQQFKRMAERTGLLSTGEISLQIEQLRFADELMDLNQDIQAYQLMKTGALELGAAGDTRTAEDLKIEISSEKSKVLEDYLALLDATGDDKELRGAIEDRYQSAVDALQGWEPGMDWVWYGPSQSLPEDPYGESLP
ncbi:MAG: hypothetical protein J0M09_16095 [Xanthomonadales bacterium]|nr:hypothetical protein [Xanthomonadales bacterium]